jgi:glycosyltransferase involved in cell wall biosynthesis
MPRVILLARHFPPIGGPGVQRTLGSVRHLPSHGYEPIVVTGTARHRDRWEPRDPGLYERVPSELAVHRVEGPEPAARSSRVATLRSAPPPWVRFWVERSVELACDRGRGADAVIASCLPYETAFAGDRVARALDCPWIADLEDPWALDETRPALSALHHVLAVRTMRRALSTASAIVMSSPHAAQLVRTAMPELAEKVRVTSIPIGFEPGDFEAGEPRPPGEAFRVVHTGSLHTEPGQRLRRTQVRRRLLGGTARGLDILTRSHVFLAEAVASAMRADPGLEGRVELHLAGDLTHADRAASSDYTFIRAHGQLSHRDSVDLMRSADLLFLPMHDLPEGVRAGLVPYKTYEYLGARRPILAAVPDGDVRDMLSPLPQATLVRPADVNAMAGALRERIDAATTAPGGREPDSPVSACYTRARSVAQIAAVLDGVLGRPSSTRLAA